MNGLPQYGGGGGIKRPPPEDDKKPLDNCLDPAKRLNLDPAIKSESPPSVSDFSSHDFGKYSGSSGAAAAGGDSKSDIVAKLEPKEEVLNFKDDSLGDLDGIMNSDTFNDLMSDLNIPNDFIDQVNFYWIFRSPLDFFRSWLSRTRVLLGVFPPFGKPKICLTPAPGTKLCFDLHHLCQLFNLLSLKSCIYLFFKVKVDDL